MGVAGATAAEGPIFTAGLAGLVAGAVSMALGEYVSVSSQRDAETAQLAQEKRELDETPEEELAELSAIYEAKGLSPQTARQVAAELTAQRRARLRTWTPSCTSTPTTSPTPCKPRARPRVSFTVGALLPLLAILFPPQEAGGYQSRSLPCS